MSTATEPHTTDVRELPAVELAKKLAGDLSLLVREEVELTKRETRRELSKAGRDALEMSAGGVVAFIGALALTGALILLLAYVMPLWVSALVVGAVMAAAGAILLWNGKKKLQELDNVPKNTATRLKRDIGTIQEAAR